MFEIKKVQQSTVEKPTFSILLPTWNNLRYLQMCVESIRKNAHFDHQIIVIINEGKDGTLNWVRAQSDLDYVYATENIGICFGLNAARSLVRSQYICYLNDDMYVCPNWDLPLLKAIEAVGHDYFFISGTMIEPTNTNNPCVIVQDYGDNLDRFQEAELLKNYATFPKKDWQGATWPPNVLHLDLWDLVGGYSIEFSPGMYSDPDLSRKLWAAGVRHFQGVGASRVYHFGSKSTGKVKHNKGKKAFLMKWGISSRDFTKAVLNRGATFEKATILKMKKTNLLHKIKMMVGL